jgi:ADP-ribosyl-[dinitrogen reductase] hydrolase
VQQEWNVHVDELFNSREINARRGPIFDQDPVPLPAGCDFERIRGMMLGLAMGDALGNTSEGQSPSGRRAAHGQIDNYLPNGYADNRRVGLPSDDTQLAFWTLEHLIDNGELVPERLALLFARRPIFGIGQTVSGFLTNHHQGVPWQRCGVASAGNGALMRIAPVLIPYASRPDTRLWSDAALCTMLTHNDPAAISSCVAFVAILWDLLGMQRAPEPEWWIDRYVEIARPLEGATQYRPRGGQFRAYAGPLWRFVDRYVRDAHRSGLDVLEACEAWSSGAYLLETVPSVLYILMRHGDDAEAAIIRAVNDARDNDTHGAIVGAAVGALHGAAALPERWRANLIGRTQVADDGRVFELLEEAEELFGRASRVESEDGNG